MPIYQYRCRQCGQVSEFLLSTLPENETQACSSCGSSNMERLISAPSLLKTSIHSERTTCCGRTERCDTPPCSTDTGCHRG